MIDKVLSLLLTSAVTLHSSPEYSSSNCHLYDCDKGGYLITLGEIDPTESPIVIGYSEKGNLDAALANPNFQHWLASYCDYVDYLKSEMGYTEQQLRELWTIGTEDDQLGNVEPLCHTRWGQLSPYNYYCPKDSEGNVCYTGCVATAMAQVMYYHQWPASPHGTGTYFDPIESQQYVPLDDYKFNWSAMLESYEHFNPTSRDAVARLMWACGLAINSQYTGYGTSAYVCRVAHGMIENMDYSHSIRYLRREYCNSSEWIETLRTELEAGRPVIFGGQSRIDGGHCFVIDGIDSQNFLHVNWGWYGEEDGYFNVNYMFPVGNAKSGFVFTQEAVIGIQKPGEDEESLRFDQPLSLQGGLSFSNANPTRRGTFSVVFNEIENYTGYDFEGHIGLALYQNDQRLEVLKSTALSLEEVKGLEKKTLMLSVPAKYAEGKYELRPVSLCDINSDWLDMLCPVTTTGSIILDITADSLHLSTIPLIGNVSWTGLTFEETEVIISSDSTVQVNPSTILPVGLVLSNNGNVPYEGQVGLALVNKKGEGQWSATTTVIVYPGESHEVGFECAVPAIEGTYYFMAAYLNPEDNSTVFFDATSDMVTTLLVQSSESGIETINFPSPHILTDGLHNILGSKVTELEHRKFYIREGKIIILK